MEEYIINKADYECLKKIANQLKDEQKNSEIAEQLNSIISRINNNSPNAIRISSGHGASSMRSLLYYRFEDLNMESVQNSNKLVRKAYSDIRKALIKGSVVEIGILDAKNGKHVSSMKVFRHGRKK